MDRSCGNWVAQTKTNHLQITNVFIFLQGAPLHRQSLAIGTCSRNHALAPRNNPTISNVFLPFTSASYVHRSYLSSKLTPLSIFSFDIVLFYIINNDTTNSTNTNDTHTNTNTTNNNNNNNNNNNSNNNNTNTNNNYNYNYNYNNNYYYY